MVRLGQLRTTVLLLPLNQSHLDLNWTCFLFITRDIYLAFGFLDSKLDSKLAERDESCVTSGSACHQFRYQMLHPALNRRLRADYTTTEVCNFKLQGEN